jgi:ATP diphosphatase
MVVSAAMQELLGIMSALRDKQTGCPWDIAQDFNSLAPYAIEEAYEVADAIERKQFDELKDELGDLLLQVVFHSQLAKEQGLFVFEDVVAAINNKMIRRHPHVFPTADGTLLSVADAEAQTLAWEAIKKLERDAHAPDDISALAGIGNSMPEWMRALKLQKRAASVGFDWPNVECVFDKLQEEIVEVREELTHGVGHAALQDEIGDILFVCVNLARHAKVDFGAALRQANHKFESRFRAMEQLASKQGVSLNSMSLNQQEDLWQLVKTQGASNGTI